MGANFGVRFRRIILPLIFPAMTTVLLLRSVEMWKEFIFPYVLAGNYPLLGTLIEGLYNSSRSPDEASLVALILVGCTLVTLVIIVEVMGFLKRTMVDGDY